MKLTRRKISEDSHRQIIKATFYRDISSGKLYLESKDVDCTRKVVESMNYERSWRGRILKKAEKDDNPFNGFVKGLVNSDTEIVCEPIKDNVGDTNVLINKYISEFGKNLKSPDSPYTLKELIHRIQDGTNSTEIKPELIKIKRLIHKDIEKRIEQLTKSISNNSIPFELKNNKLVPSTKKMKWLYQFLNSSMDEHMLDEYWDNYCYEELEKNINKNIEALSNKNARSISRAVSKAVHDHHRYFCLNLSDTIIKEESLHKDSSQESHIDKKKPSKEDFLLFIKVVEQHFKKYFPVKGKDSNDEHDNKLCDEKNYEFFYSYDFVKHEVNRSIINQLVAGLIQQGKLIHYFCDNSTWKKEYLNSDGLSYIQVEEAFKKSLMNAISWGIMRLTSFFYDGEVDGDEVNDYDILLAESFVNERFNELRRNIGAQNRFKEKLAGYFPIKNREDEEKDNDDIGNIIELAKECRESVKYLRHNIFHYKFEKTSLVDIFKNIDDKKKFETAEIFLKRDIDNIYNVFKEQIRSYGILEYYPTWLIEACFKTCGLEFTLYNPRNSLIPSFSKIYKKGVNLYKSEKKYHKGLHWYIEVDNSNPSHVAYKNLLQLIYYHGFLPQVSKDETLVTRFINSTKEWNKIEVEKVGKRNNNKSSRQDDNDNKSFKAYRYAAIPDYHGETLDDYLKILQREQTVREKEISEGKTDKNNYIMFIQDVVVRAFDRYLKKLSKYQDELQIPTKQEINIDKALEELFPSEKQNRKFNMTSRFNNYTKISENKHMGTKDGKNKDRNASYHTEKQSCMEKEILCFYLFLRLLDAKEISKLQHQFIRYRCSLRERSNLRSDQENVGLISLLEELEELMELVRYTIPILPTSELAGKEKSNYDTILQQHFRDFFEKGLLEKRENQKLYYQSNNKTPIPLKHLSQLIHSAPLSLYRRMFKNYYLITEDDFKEYYDLSKSIEEYQQKLNELHKILVKEKVRSKKINSQKGKHIVFLTQKNADLVKEYEDKLNKVVRYKHLHSKLTFESLYLIFKIHVELLARMIGYVQDWERDMYFLLLSLEDMVLLNEHANIKGLFGEGRIVKKFGRDDYVNSDDKKKLFWLCWHRKPLNNELTSKIWIRNIIAHLNHFTQSENKPKPSIEKMINSLRDLLYYDRKRQNAVTKTIKDLLLKEYHIRIEWKLSHDTLNLDICNIKNKPLIHLKHFCKGEKCIIDKKAYLREKQEIWLRNGILEEPYDDYLRRCIERLFIFPKEVRTSSEHK